MVMCCAGRKSCLENECEAEGKQSKGRPNMAWTEQDEEEHVMVGLSLENVISRSTWIVGVNWIATGLR